MHSNPLIDREPVGMVDQAVSMAVFHVDYDPLPPRKWWDLWSLIWPPRPRAVRVFDLKLDFGPIVPGTLVFTFDCEPANQAWTACDNGAGVLFGDATGHVNYETVEFKLVTSKAMPPGTKVFASYVYDVESTVAVPGTLRSTPRISSSARTDS